MSTTLFSRYALIFMCFKSYKNAFTVPRHQNISFAHLPFSFSFSSFVLCKRNYHVSFFEFVVNFDHVVRRFMLGTHACVWSWGELQTPPFCEPLAQWRNVFQEEGQNCLLTIRLHATDFDGDYSLDQVTYQRSPTPNVQCTFFL